MKSTELANLSPEEKKLEGNIVGRESDFLNEIVKDCIYYNLDDDESIRYIEIRFKRKITLNILWNRRAKLRSEESGRLWLNYFTREGFVLEHQGMLDKVKRLIDDAMNEYFHEKIKPYEPIVDKETGNMTHTRPHELRDDFKIRQLKKDIRESIALLKELMMDSPIISEVKVRIEAEINAKIQLASRYGIILDEDGNILEKGNQRNTEQVQGNRQKDPSDDPERIFS